MSASAVGPPAVEVVVPTHHEEAGLEPSIRRLHGYLPDRFPFSWRITIADNGSSDGTPDLDRRLAAELPGVSALVLAKSGRGRALKAAWRASDATVVSYMDVDLSTDLDALLPLVAPLLSGHSDLAIGSRLAPDSRVPINPTAWADLRGVARLLVSGRPAHHDRSHEPPRPAPALVAVPTRAADGPRRGGS